MAVKDVAHPQHAFHLTAPTGKVLCPRTLFTCLILTVSSLLLFVIGIQRPPSYVYDEQAYVSSAKALLAHAPNPNPEHPPLGKYLISLGIRLFGDRPLGWRIASAVSGAMTLAAIFLWSYLLLRDSFHAVLAAALTLFNNFLFVMSRTAMLDVFMFMFVMWALVGFTAALHLDMSARARRALLLVTGVMFGLAGSCKWNALTTWAVVIAVAGVLLSLRGRALRNEGLARGARNLKQAGFPLLIFALIVLPLFTYLLAAYVPLFRTVDRPFDLREVARLHAFMWSFLKAVKGNRAIHLPWYRWPFSASPQRALSYLMGNFVVMWGGLVALAICARRIWQKLPLPETLVVLFYAANLLQWAVTPRKVSYYYYYYPAAMFLGVAIALVLHRSGQRRLFGVRLSFLTLIASMIFFLFCYPRMTHLEAPWDCMFGCWT